jgi:hypothetical protein
MRPKRYGDYSPTSRAAPNRVLFGVFRAMESRRLVEILANSNTGSPASRYQLL